MLLAFLVGVTTMYAIRWGRSTWTRHDLWMRLMALGIALIAAASFGLGIVGAWTVFVVQQLSHDLTHNHQPRLSRGPVR